MSRWITRIFHIYFPCVVLIHSILFILFWLTNSLFYSETNDYLAKKVGMRLDFISICLVLAGLISLWSLARLILYWKGIKHRLSTLTSILYSAFGLFFIAFFYGSFWLLFSESPVQLQRIEQMIVYFRLILDTIILLGVAVGAGLFVRGRVVKDKATNQKVNYLPILLALIIVTVLWIIPVLFPPGSVFKGDLAPKPLLIAHRGASMLAPENTLVSSDLAARLGVYGLETDIHISSDGKPFLLHDDTFVRTTDVDEMYPERAKDRAEYFSLAEATQLNAGEWFVERDPYGTINDGLVSESQIAEYRVQTVPTLEAGLKLIKVNQLAFIFDIKQPPSDQPYNQSFFEIVLNEIHEARVDPQVWFLADMEQKDIVMAIAPEMKLASGVDFQSPTSAETLITNGYEMVNAEYGLSEEWIDAYHAAGLWVNLYTIDEPWQYSRLWLLGVDSTTSSNVHTLVEMERAVFSFSNGQYLLLWGIIGLICLGVVLGLTIPVYRWS